MASWLQRQIPSHQAQIVGTAVLTGLAVAGAMLGIQALRHHAAIDNLASTKGSSSTDSVTEKVHNTGTTANWLSISKEDERAAALARRAQHGDYDQELIQEQLTRTNSFLKPEGLQILQSSFVVIVGLGGVGSHCTAALARSGISHLRLIDFDQVTLSSLNRHAVATLADVGTPKVSCVRKRLEAVVPWVQWECFNEVWCQEHGERLLGGWGGGEGKRPDYVIDAIDNIDSKVALLQYCHGERIKVVSSMGAGCKSDPTRVYVGDISGSVEDPLSRSTRRRLRMSGVTDGIPVIYSIEKPGPGKATLLPLPEEEYQRGSVGELGVLPDFRARILPVLGTMPAVFGYTAANFILLELTNYPHEVGGAKGREKLYESVLQDLLALEEKLARAEGEDVRGLRLPITKTDVGYLIEEIFRGQSVVSGLPTRLALVRWRQPKNGYMPDTRVNGQKCSRLRLGELVCMTKEEVAVHERKVLREGASADDLYEAEIVQRVQKRLEEEWFYDRYR